jgi:hypothetical protein
LPPIISSPSFGGRGLKVRVVRLNFALTLALSRERERETICAVENLFRIGVNRRIPGIRGLAAVPRKEEE